MMPDMDDYGASVAHLSELGSHIGASAAEVLAAMAWRPTGDPEVDGREFAMLVIDARLFLDELAVDNR